MAASKKLIWTATDKPEAEFWDVQNSLMGVFGSNDAKEGPRALRRKACSRMDRHLINPVLINPVLINPVLLRRR